MWSFLEPSWIWFLSISALLWTWFRLLWQSWTKYAIWCILVTSKWPEPRRKKLPISEQFLQSILLLHLPVFWDASWDFWLWYNKPIISVFLANIHKSHFTDWISIACHWTHFSEKHHRPHFSLHTLGTELTFLQDTTLSKGIFSSSSFLCVGKRKAEEVNM